MCGLGTWQGVERGDELSILTDDACAHIEFADVDRLQADNLFQHGGINLTVGLMADVSQLSLRHAAFLSIASEVGQGHVAHILTAKQGLDDGEGDRLAVRATSQ